MSGGSSRRVRGSARSTVRTGPLRLPSSRHPNLRRVGDPRVGPDVGTVDLVVVEGVDHVYRPGMSRSTPFAGTCCATPRRCGYTPYMATTYPTATLDDYRADRTRVVAWVSTHTTQVGKSAGATYTLDHSTVECPQVVAGNDPGHAPIEGDDGWPCPFCIVDERPAPNSYDEDTTPTPRRGDGTGSGSTTTNQAATDKQVALLTALARGGFVAKGVDEVEARVEAWVADKVKGGRKVVSAAIDTAKDRGVKPMWRAVEVEVVEHTHEGCDHHDDVEVAPTTPTPSSTYTPKRGEVHVIDDRYYRVSVSRSSGRPYVNVWTGADWDYAPGIARRLSAATVATADQAAAFGAAYERCVFCTRDLDTPESISVGYGPVCAAKFGLPWGKGVGTTDPTPEATTSATSGVCGRHGTDLDERGRCWECDVEVEVAKRDREEG